MLLDANFSDQTSRSIGVMIFEAKQPYFLLSPRGKDVGRPRKATRQIGDIATRYLEQGVGVSQIAKNLGLSRATIYKSLDLVSA